jgi:phospholipid/cholesterol/gamma-HCH transport system substrate-binding protein
MEREANYFAVGAFVILVTALLGLFVYWYSEGRDQADYVRYEMYFHGSVTGLSEGGSVRYLGVEVGKVRRVRLDARSADRVMVVADIDSAAPISERTTAELSMMSFATGLLYVDLRQNNGNRELLPPVASLRYPVIASVRSTLDSFMDSLPDLAASASVLMERAKEIFSQENSKRLADLVANLHDATQKLPGTMERIDTLLGELVSTSREVRRLTASVTSATTELTPQVRQLVDKLNGIAVSLEQAGTGINGFVQENRASITGFTKDGLPQLQRLLEEASDAAAEVRELSKSLKADPSQLIYQPAARGVEVPR